MKSEELRDVRKENTEDLGMDIEEEEEEEQQQQQQQQQQLQEVS